MSYLSLRSDAPSRGVSDIDTGDYVKIGSNWEQVASRSGDARTNPKGDWSVTTVDGRSHSGWGINRYAKAEDLETR